MKDQIKTTEQADQALRAAIVAQLVADGWIAVPNGTAIAIKSYATAVGPKDALVYLADFGRNEANYVLQGEYYSEGRNALAADAVLIPKSGDPAEVMRLVERFAAGAEKSVLESYAARLYLLGVRPADQAEEVDEEGEGGEAARLRGRCDEVGQQRAGRLYMDGGLSATSSAPCSRWDAWCWSSSCRT